MQKVKILCTMGPACDSVPTLVKLLQAGMTIARLNMAHGDLPEHQERIKRIREAAGQLNRIVPILIDIKGPEIRIGQLQAPSYELIPNNTITLTTEVILGSEKRITISYQELPQHVVPGSIILIDDGLIQLKVESAEGTEIVCRIISGGTIKPRKGVNLPGIHTTLPGVTEKDIKHILFAIAEGIHIIALSFVRRAEDIIEIRKLLETNNAAHIQIIAKIENQEGVDNLDAILEVSDGLMVARGDLGVDIPIEEVPIIQKLMIAKCNAAGKPVITATHMLESMQLNPRPTRAEASDVANAVLDGTDILMLSGETAVGKYPVEAVTMMAAIASRVDTLIDYKANLIKNSALQKTNITEVISQSVVHSSIQLEAKAILIPTESGFTARMVSKYRPKAPIIAITPHEKVLYNLCLLKGVIPVKGTPLQSTDEMFRLSIKHALDNKMIQNGDLIVLTAGVPIGKSGSTNLIRIDVVKE
ncbi:pyruvate kinase [Paenibacillus psychroresistens]|uniref:Pyruvate kinase n=1 Tax=Paenibacillus psychroresistens TaxID=1778678 RepID=A0A6B8RSP8_9BACL|nr:pyruvate kinase [Paenibacillus psychroresistens]QGQ99460.1 pyruvate kinase [Paenibacillus psychroresistens]